MNLQLSNKLHKKMLLSMNIAVFVIFSVYSWALTTLYVKAETDIAFMIPVFTDLIPYITDLCEILGILTAYAYIIFAYYKFQKDQTSKYIISFIALVLYKYIAKFAITYIMNGAIPTVKTLIEDIAWAFIVPFALELAQLLIVALITKNVIKTALQYIKEKKSLENKLDDYRFDEKQVFFPFIKLFNMQNPFQKICLWIGVIIAGSKMLQLLIIDIQTGLPTDFIDFLWIITSYTLSAVLGLASYLFMMWMLIKLNADEIKNKYI